MIDWRRLVGFDWDAGNERKSADKRRVSQAEAEQTFFNQPLPPTSATRPISR